MVGGGAAPDYSKDRGKGGPIPHHGLGGRVSREAACHRKAGPSSPSSNNETVKPAAEWGLRGLLPAAPQRPEFGETPQRPTDSFECPNSMLYPFKFRAFMPWQKINLTRDIEI